jgi:hypothetical protein
LGIVSWDSVSWDSVSWELLVGNCSGISDRQTAYWGFSVYVIRYAVRDVAIVYIGNIYSYLGLEK